MIYHCQLITQHILRLVKKGFEGLEQMFKLEHYDVLLFVSPWRTPQTITQKCFQLSPLNTLVNSTIMFM